MAFCIYCGNKLTDGTKYCSKCGADAGIMNDVHKKIAEDSKTQNTTNTYNESYNINMGSNHNVDDEIRILNEIHDNELRNNRSRNPESEKNGFENDKKAVDEVPVKKHSAIKQLLNNPTFYAFTIGLIVFLVVFYLSRGGEQQEYRTIYDFLFKGVFNHNVIDRIKAFEEELDYLSVGLYLFLRFLWFVIAFLGIIFVLGTIIAFATGFAHNFFRTLNAFLVAMEFAFLTFGADYTIALFIAFAIVAAFGGGMYAVDSLKGGN